MLCQMRFNKWFWLHAILICNLFFTWCYILSPILQQRSASSASGWWEDHKKVHILIFCLILLSIVNCSFMSVNTNVFSSPFKFYDRTNSIHDSCRKKRMMKSIMLPLFGDFIVINSKTSQPVVYFLCFNNKNPLYYEVKPFLYFVLDYIHIF